MLKFVEMDQYERSDLMGNRSVCYYFVHFFPVSPPLHSSPSIPVLTQRSTFIHFRKYLHSMLMMSG